GRRADDAAGRGGRVPAVRRRAGGEVPGPAGAAGRDAQGEAAGGGPHGRGAAQGEAEAVTGGWGVKPTRRDGWAWIATCPCGSTSRSAPPGSTGTPTAAGTPAPPARPATAP